MLSSKRFLLHCAMLGCLLGSSCNRSFQRVLTVPNAMLPLGAFAPPEEGSAIKGQVVFGGWGAHPSGIAFVALYLDGAYLATSPIGVDRPDVLKVFPQFKPSMVSGFDIAIDVTPWSAGPHQLIAKIVSKIGTDRDYPLNVVVVK